MLFEGEARCPLCGSKRTKVRCSLHDNDFFPQKDFKFIRCSTCRFIFLYPQPTTEQIKLYYTKRYNEEPRDDLLKIKILSPYLMRVKEVNRFRKGGRIIDIGCGEGEFLRLIADCGWDISGVEISEPAAKIAKGKVGEEKIYTADFSLIDLPSGCFDAVTFWRVLDHLVDPAGILRKANRILKKGGYLFLEVPNASSFQRKLFSSSWEGYKSARHLYKFSPRSIDKLLALTGFKLIKISSSLNRYENLCALKLSILNSLGFHSNSACAEGAKRSRLWKIVRFNLNLICFAVSSALSFLGSGDNLFIVAEK